MADKKNANSDNNKKPMNDSYVERAVEKCSLTDLETFIFYCKKMLPFKRIESKLGKLEKLKTFVLRYDAEGLDSLIKKIDLIFNERQERATREQGKNLAKILIQSGKTDELPKEALEILNKMAGKDGLPKIKVENKENG